MARSLIVRLSFALFVSLLVPSETHANVLHSISFVTEHPRFNIVLIQTKSNVSSYRVGQFDKAGRTAYVELKGVTRGDQRPEIDVNGGALRRLRVEYIRAKRSTRILLDLRPGVRPQDIVHRKLSNKNKGQILLLIDLPRGQTGNIPSEEEAKRLRDEGKRIVIIDPGHGWLDPGCQSYGMQEKTICLDIGRKLAALINQADNMKAYLTRDGDYLPVMKKDDYSGTWRQIKSKSLSARLEFARRMHGQVFVSLHLNWARREGARGFEILYLGRDNSQSVYNDEIDGIDRGDLLAFGDLSESSFNTETGKLLFSIQRDIITEENDIFVELLKNELLKVRGLVPREPPIKSRSKLRVLRTLSMPSALVEMAFLSNAQEARSLRTTEFRWKLATALYHGIAQSFDDRSNRTPYAQGFQVSSVSVPSEKYDIHIVKSKENLFSIAQRYGTDVSTLQRINGKGRSTTILTGEELKVPRVGSSPTNQVYTVRTGDSLYEIARRHGITVTELKRINRLKSNTIRPGKKLYVPSKTYAQGSSPAQQTSTYKVRRGDSLWEIATRFRTSVRRLRSLNGLRSNTINPGQKLRVPAR